MRFRNAEAHNRLTMPSRLAVTLIDAVGLFSDTEVVRVAAEESKALEIIPALAPNLLPPVRTAKPAGRCAAPAIRLVTCSDTRRLRDVQSS